MARLEIDIALNNLQGATTGLKTLQDSLKQLSGKGVKIEVGGTAIAEAKVQAIQATTAIKEMVASANVNNATFLTKVKAEGIEAKTAVTQLSGELISSKVELEKQKSSLVEVTKAGKELDNQNKVTRNSIAKLTEQTKLYALEQKKLRNEQGSSKSLNEYQKLSRELTAVRNEAKNVGAQMYKLTQTGQQATPVFQKLEKEFNDLKNKSTQLDSGLKTIDGSLGQFQRNVGNYEGKMANANGVTMEFNRIIQDAPFGMMGIGNNIQQLAANWQIYSEQAKRSAAETGKTIGTMGLMRGVMAQFLTTGNLITFGIAAITSAWTAYSMNVKTAKEETRDMNNQFTTQAGQLQNIISLTQKSALTQRDKATAVSEYNKNLGDTLGTVKTYGELEQKLIQNGATYVNYLSLKAQAEATYQLALKKTGEMMNNIMMLESNGRSSGFFGWVAKASDTIDELVYGKGTQGKTKITANDARRIAQLPTDKEFYIAIRGMGDALKRGLKDVRADWKKQLKLADLGGDLTQEFNKIGDKLNLKFPDLNLDKDGNLTKGNKALEKAVKLVNNYLELLKEISSISGLGSVDYSTLGKVGIDLEVGKVKAELDQVLRDIDAYKTKVLNDTTISESQRTNLIAKANADREILEGRHLAKMKILQQDYTKRIEEMTVKPVKTVATMDEIQSTEEPEWMKKQKELTRAIKSEINNILNMLPNLSGGFSDIFAQLTNGLNDILQKALVERLGEMITKKMKQLDDETQMIAGALAVAGKTLQGLFSKTSGVGQGIGGAMSGAGAGLGIGSMLASTLGKSAGPWGAAIGGAIGLVSGIIGAKKAKKQEEMQRKQLEEQKKANALLERMNALAYTSSIIGGQSQYGIVSGVNRNAQGEFTFKIDGRDLVAVMGNNERLIGR